MIKPLLRTLPSLSGNVKLACTLTDVQSISSDNKTYEANIRGARLLPISSQLWQKSIQANLLSSTWEYDLPKFYAAYSDVFYNSCFEYVKDDMLKLNKHESQKVRASDFEFGVKRISYTKNGSQFAFFAPIYIDNSDCIPSYFIINVTWYNTNAAGKLVYAIKKSIRVNIGVNSSDKKNYIYKYLYNYTRKIDDNVIFCTPFTNQATVYGIDLQHQGFVTSVDNMMEQVYSKQNTIHNFDATIVGVFKRNRIAMKQIIPLCYYFNADDLLTDTEKIRYRNCKIEFDGEYYDCNGNKLGMYDFSNDYTQYTEDILRMNPLTGSLEWSAGEESNLMDTIFPSLNEKRYINYEFANKLAPWFCRWKLKYTDDEHPYTMNNSWAFSKNQGSNYRYGQFPSTFHYLTSLANYIKTDNNYNYNLMFPVGDINNRNSGRALYAYAPYWQTVDDKFVTGPYNYIIDRYKQIIENYCSNWFETVNEYNDSIFENTSLWKGTVDDCVYYNGILYDLKNVYNLSSQDETIDKFAVILQPVLKTFTEADISDLRFSRYSLYRQNVSPVSKPNVIVNDSLLTMSQVQREPNYLYDNDEFDSGGKVNQDELRFGEIFKESYTNNGNYIDMQNTAYMITLENGDTAYGKLQLDYYDMNKYYMLSDINKITYVINDVTNEFYNREDTVMKNMISSYIEPHYGKHGDVNVDTSYSISYAYLFTPVYKLENITYDNIVFSYENVLSGWSWTSYVIDPVSYAAAISAYNIAYSYYSEARDIWESYNDVNLDLYRITHNSSIITVPTSYSDREYTYSYAGVEQYSTLFDILAQNSYVRNSAQDTSYMIPSKVGGIWNGVSYSYLRIVDPKYNDINYGSQHYFSSYLVKSTYIPYIESSFDSYSYLRDVYSSYFEDLTNVSYLFEWENMYNEHPAAYWAGRLTYWKNKVSEEISHRLYNNNDNVQEYEYVPIMQESGDVFAKNVFKERSCWTGRFYGDSIPQSKVNEDNDVLWADPYNFTKIFESEGKEIPSNAVYKDMFVCFLNKLHIFYWYIEIFKDKDKTWEGKSEYSEFLRNKWYKYLYIVEKKLIYDYGYTASPQVKLIYTPLEKLLEFPEYYSSTDEKTSYSYNVANDPYRSFMSFYNHLQYDPTEGFFTLPGFFNQSMSPYDYLKWVNEPETEYISDETNVGIINEMMSPIIEHGEYGHRYEELSYSYIGDDKKTYGHYEPIKFELVYRKKMYRVDEDLWGLTHMSDGADEYRDIYFFRLQSEVEHEAKYNLTKKFNFQSDMSYIVSDLEKISSYTYIDITEGTRYIDGQPVTYNIYNYGVAYYDKPHVLTDCGMSYIQQSDSMLIPMFDDIFIQTASESTIYTHYSLHDINVCDIVNDMPSGKGVFDKITSNYRYNKPDKLMMIDVSDSECKKYSFVETYEKYNECYSKLVIKDDDLGYGKFGLSTKVAEDGTKYGFYYINSYINNTSNTFNIIGISDKEAIPGIKYINYINRINIVQNPKYISDIYKQLLPFINQQPLNVMSDVNTIIYPKTYSMDLLYSPKIYNSNNGSKETDIILNSSKLRTTSLLRYFHAMTPLIVPTNVITNEWRLKLKDVNGQMLDTGKYISIGDAPIYSETVHINQFEPYRVYSPSNNQIEMKNYNNITSYYTPLEYKFYNNSTAINLETHFEIKINGKMTYDELLTKETDDVVFELFKKRLNGRIRTKYDDDELLFLLNKYKVSYDSVAVGLNMQHTEKLYTLTIVFDLL